MFFSEKVEELTKTRNLARLAEEAKLGDNLKNWRNGRADKNGPKFWGPVVRLANACDLNADQTSDLLWLAQMPPFEELQYAKPDDEILAYAEATREAIAAIQRRSESSSLYSFPNYRQGALPSQYAINEGDMIPRDRFSEEQLLPFVQEVEKRNLKLELKLVYVVASAIVAVLVIISATLIASPAAREIAVRTVSPIVERVRQIFKDQFEPLPQPDPTMSPEPLPTSTVVSSATSTRTVTPVATPTLNGTEEAVIRTTDIAVAVNQTLAAVTPTATVIESTPKETTVATEIPTPIPTQTPTPSSAYPCETEIISPRGIWPLSISFRNVPDGASSITVEFQSGDSVIIQKVSADGRWYEIAELGGRVLGWASPEFFKDCIQTSQ